MTRSADDVDSLLAEQVAYYRARAPEYDDWWARRGPEFDMGPVVNQSVRDNQEQLYASLTDAALRGHALELAAGTGTFTAQLLRHADRVTAVDASPETLALNREKNGTERVEHVVADLFTWDPPRRYDAVSFSFWISHIPPARWVAFWDLVDRALVPDGTVWFCDNAHPAFVETVAPEEFWSHRERAEGRADAERGQQRRRLPDGRRFDVVKRYWQPADLTAELAELGWAADVAHTDWVFVHGTARRAQGST
jgi:demethylmenaquinone methyltransferase/2-methoxy-6-polyprenyl-1,4-benzoquinol methylase